MYALYALWYVENTNFDIYYGLGMGPIFTHAIADDEMDYLKADFEAAIMTPVINWWETSHNH